MLKSTVSYPNVDGVIIEKDIYFNISANELIQKEADSGQTYSEKLKEIASSNQLRDIYPAILEMMGQGYGVRTDDGDFEKDPTGEAWKKFQGTLAFQALMDDLLIKDAANNGNRLAEFVNGMLPASLVNKVAEQNAVPGFRPGADTSRPTPPVAGEQPVPAPAQPVESAPAEPMVQAPPTLDNFNTTPAVQPPALTEDNGGSISQFAEPREPELPGQAPQQ